MDILNQYLTKFDMLILIMVRMSGIFVIAPIFGARNLPTYFKIGLAFFASLIVSSVIAPVSLTHYDNLIAYSVLVFKELAVGIFLGLIAYIIFNAIYLAGQIIDMQIGFGVVNVFDPMTNAQVPITGNFYYMLALLIFLVTDGHHFLISALFRSYEMVPLGQAVFSEALIDTMTALLSDMFVIGFKISAPIVLAILITDIALGILTKTMPQLNVFMVGLPAKIFIGLFVMFVTMPVFINIMDVLREGIYKDTLKVIEEMVIK